MRCFTRGGRVQGSKGGSGSGEPDGGGKGANACELGAEFEDESEVNTDVLLNAGDEDRGTDVPFEVERECVCSNSKLVNVEDAESGVEGYGGDIK